MILRDKQLSSGSVKSIRFRPEDLELLREYIKKMDIRANNNRLVSINKAVENMVHSFCEEEIKPMIESKIREQSQMLEARNARKIEHQHELKSKMKRKEHHKKNKARISLRNVSEENEELVNNDHERKSVVRITIYPKRYYEEKAKKKEEEQKIELKPIDLEKGLSEKQKRTLQYFIDQGIPAASITIDTKKDKFYSNGKRLF